MKILCPLCQRRIPEWRWRQTAGTDNEGEVFCKRCMVVVHPIIISEGSLKVEQKLTKDLIKLMEDNRKWWIKEKEGKNV